MRTFFIILFIIIPSIVLSFNKEDLEYKNKVNFDNIKSMRMHLDGWEVSYPILDINSDNKLLFSFDKIESDREVFYYTIVHFNSDWKASNLMFFEFAEGFEENQIRDYESSFNTFVSYTHYNVLLPNEDIKFIKPGNYLLIVYKINSNEKEIVCKQKFMIVDNILNIEGRVNLPADNLYRRTSHKLDFRISRKNFYISDPLREIKIVIMQNFQWHNKIEGLQPSFLNNYELVYEFEERNVFRASNEYRYFTFHDTERLSERVDLIDFRHPYFFVKLFPDESNLFRRYSRYEDINGRYIIHTQRYGQYDYPEIESDYAIVSFRLNYDIPVDNADVYIFGELSNWEISDEFKMTYSLEERAYEKLLLLKQGYYNYRYILVNNQDSKNPDHSFFEGSHFETENDYLLLVYHRQPGRSYDKLIGFKKFNSRNY